MSEKQKSINILNIDLLVEKLTKFIELKLEIYELKVKQQLVIVISSLATLGFIIACGIFVIFFASVALGFYLNGVLESKFIGFIIVSVIYLLICIILILFRDKIITNRLLQAIFSDTIAIESDEQEDQQ